MSDQPSCSKQLTDSSFSDIKDEADNEKNFVPFVRVGNETFPVSNKNVRVMLPVSSYAARKQPKKPLIDLLDRCSFKKSRDMRKYSQKPYFPPLDALMTEFGVPQNFKEAKDTYTSVHMVNQRLKSLQVLRGENKYLDAQISDEKAKCERLENAVRRIQEKSLSNIEYRRHIQETIENLCNEISELQEQCGVTLVETGEEDDELTADNYV